MFTSIAGRAVVVTGASRGIGKGIARVFASAGARVLIVGRDAEAAKATVAELSATGAEASYVLADVSRREDCQQIAAAAAERFGGIDVLCANAGIFPAAPLAEMTDEEIGYAALFLATDEAGYITGQTIVVDGGQVLPESLAALDG